MLTCSNEFKAAFQADTTHKNYTITVDAYTLTNEDIYGDSLELKQSVMDELIEYVGCISSTLSFTASTENLPKNDYTGSKVTLSVSIVKADLSTETLKLFTGYVDSNEVSADGHWQSFVCYDILSYIGDTKVWNFYKKAFTSSGVGSPCTIKAFRDYIIETCLGISQISQTLPNDAVKIKKRCKNKDMTALDLMKYICQVNGVWGYIDPNGKFGYISPTGASTRTGAIVGTFKAGEETVGHEKYTYGATTTLEWYRSLEYSHSTINPLSKGATLRTSESDSGVTVTWDDYQDYVSTDWDDTSDDTYLAEDDDITTSTYVIQANLMAFKLAKRKKQVILANIMRAIGQNVVFREYSAQCNGQPYIQCGDVVKFITSEYPSGISFVVTSRTLKGTQDLQDTYECSPSQEYAAVVVSSQISVSNEGTYVSDITQESSTADYDTGEDSVSQLLSQKEVMYVVSWDADTGILYTSSELIEIE